MARDGSQKGIQIFVEIGASAAVDRYARVRQCAWRHFWRMAFVANGSRRQRRRRSTR